ncbi:hypothetical protein [Brucella anthropi]|uniref:hypothetical protein n=1 Tax=Brucella anthropi TaxID=529 RepID=UPI000F66CDC1|nr:hypothetical protein [Brucella anthropi]RRY11502.1 hypothetical protein EGJ58_07565 [Brucella anthropi]
MSYALRNSETQNRERKFKKAKTRPVDLTHVNFYDSDFVVALAAEATYEAVKEMFPWLSVVQIKNPPRQLMDAKLARQIAIHIMAERLGIPQRQIARFQARQRTSIHFALQTVTKRMECGTFAAAYENAAFQVDRLYREKAMELAS